MDCRRKRLTMNFQTNYLENIKIQFQYYKVLGERTFDQLEETDLFWQYNDESNAIATIVNHIQGNMKSRFTDFLTSDGEKPWRQRDQEFENMIQSKSEMLEKWEEGWKCVFDAIASITVDNFDTIIYIRNQGHTILEALNRQLAHYAYHIGQIVYIGKMIQSKDWNSLSIPKGESINYNQKKFAQEKRQEHFTKEFLK